MNQWLIDLELKSKRKLPDAVYDFIAGGADQEVALRRNRQAYEAYRIIPRCLVDDETIDTAMMLAHTPLTMPLLIAPTAPHKLLHEQAEIATVKGADQAEVLPIVSCMAAESLESIAAQSAGPLWFQLHVFRDHSVTLRLAERAASAGYQALVFTVDMPVVGNRCRDQRHTFTIPNECLSKNLMREGLWSEHDDVPTCFRKPFNHFLDPTVTWETLASIKKQVGLPVFVKGVLHPEDAVIAVDRRFDGLIVSNHGARQLGCSVSPLDILPAITQVVPNDFPVLIDGGIRSGADMLVALLLGATAVLIGRPVLWGLASGGAYGVSGVLNQMRRELQQVMRLSGLSSLEMIRKNGKKMLYKVE